MSRVNGSCSDRFAAASRRANGGGSRAGYTLLELFLVLAVLVVVAGITWPAIEGLAERHQLKQTAEDVRAHVAAARLRAIDTGTIYQFRYAPAGGEFSVLPAEPAVVAQINAENDSVSGSLPTLEGRLPDGFRFVTRDTSPARSTSAATQTGAAQIGATQIGANPREAFGSVPTAGSTAGDWSDPVLFFPDGSGTDAVFEIEDSEERYLRLSVRGLTGGVRVGDMLRRPDR